MHKETFGETKMRYVKAIGYFTIAALYIYHNPLIAIVYLALGFCELV